MLNNEKSKMKNRTTTDDCSPAELEFLDMLSQLSRTEKSQLFRYAVRLLNRQMKMETHKACNA